MTTKEYHLAIIMRIEVPLSEDKNFQALMKQINLNPVLAGRVQIATGALKSSDGDIPKADLEKMKNMIEDEFNKHFKDLPEFKALGASFEVEWIASKIGKEG